MRYIRLLLLCFFLFADPSWGYSDVSIKNQENTAYDIIFLSFAEGAFVYDSSVLFMCKSECYDGERNPLFIFERTAITRPAVPSK